MATPPALGTVQVGSLYVSSVDRSAWLGVDVSVDPAGAVLISDPLGDAAAIAAAIVSANAYTDLTLASKANVSHTHAIADVTGLAAALAAGASFPPGFIGLWYGTIISIPAGWALCNGANGTPDLRDRFVLGAGGVAAQGSVGGSQSASVLSTSPAGAHSHGGATNNHTLTNAEMPQHNHGITDPGHAHNISDPGHSHVTSYPSTVMATPGPGPATAMKVDPAVQSAVSNVSGTGVTVQGGATGITINTQGGGAAHQHTIPSEAAHQHTMSGDLRPPFFTLAYIMKLP